MNFSFGYQILNCSTLQMITQSVRVSQMGSTDGEAGGQFGQNDQKLNENDKISIFGSKQWEGGHGGTNQFFG